MSESIEISNEELFTVRDAMRELNRIVDRLQSGEIRQAVLLKGSTMVAGVQAINIKQTKGD